ncbi:hypothetical protein EPI10_020117 [Gossypium australe]|uniref:Gag-pro-like protein n=1 Tax=Gossypium australe TaxID=47621 RepID=A0A5B6WFN4_9ROSI|nr:hypothetical protein EPI10_020117 [Gossypium australe]
MENADYHCRIDAKNLSLVPDLVLPPKFKTPEFKKYNRTSCPEAHTTMFCRRMTRYVNNDQLLIHCFQDSLIGSTAKWYNQLSRAQPPYPKWYDANTQCDYHAGILGHSIENCTAFKKVVERLIKMGIAKFDDAPSTKNLLPNHTESGVNAIDGKVGRRVKTDIAEIKTPLKRVWIEMVKRGLNIPNFEGSCGNSRNYCDFHLEEGHKIQECTKFRALVQGLMDNKEIEFCEEAKEKGSICASKSTTRFPKANHPVVIISRPKNNEAGVRVAQKIIIQKQAVFSYQDSKRVPWNYDCNVTIPGRENSASTSKEDQDVARPESFVNEPVKEEKIKEFLKFLKHSEYSVVEQLHKQPARISILALLLNSEVHRSALMKVLNETYVANDISVNKLDWLVSNISANNFIFFNDDEIPPGGMGSTKALHIMTRCKDYTLLGVLIDNGSALNELPLSTFNRLPVGSSHMKVDFLVMDIKPSYNCLLGRPWIHSAGAVPSSLHQKLKLVSEDRLVTINAEEDIIATVASDAPYLEANDEAIECSFQSLEFVNATFITEGSRIPVPNISRATKIGSHLMIEKGALLRKGLGRHL